MSDEGAELAITFEFDTGEHGRAVVAMLRHSSRRWVMRAAVGVAALLCRDGLFFATPEIAQHFKWSAVQRVVETDEFLLLFVAPAAAHYIPKRPILVEIETPLRALLADVVAERPKRLLLQAWAD